MRQAFNYAIDRQKIADFTIQEKVILPITELFPIAKHLKKQVTIIKWLAVTLTILKAKELMKQAGYPDGKGYPKLTLEINSGGGDRNILVAEVVQKMLKENLNVDIGNKYCSFAEHIENVQTAKVDFFRYAWVADYPDPETFLALFYGKNVPATMQEKSYTNFSRYINPRFDSLYTAARFIMDGPSRFAMLSKAEKIMIEDAPIMPIFYDENFRLEHLNVRNLPENSMNFYDLTTTYLIPADKMKKK